MSIDEITAAKKRLQRFLSYWMVEDWTGMSALVQKSRNASPTRMKDCFGNSELISFKIKEFQRTGQNMIRARVFIRYLNRLAGNLLVETEMQPNIIYEKDSWGVNEISALRFLLSPESTSYSE